MAFWEKKTPVEEEVKTQEGLVKQADKLHAKAIKRVDDFKRDSSPTASPTNLQCKETLEGFDVLTKKADQSQEEGVDVANWGKIVQDYETLINDSGGDERDGDGTQETKPPETIMGQRLKIYCAVEDDRSAHFIAQARKLVAEAGPTPVTSDEDRLTRDQCVDAILKEVATNNIDSSSDRKDDRTILAAKYNVSEATLLSIINARDTVFGENADQRLKAQQEKASAKRRIKDEKDEYLAAKQALEHEQERLRQEGRSVEETKRAIGEKKEDFKKKAKEALEQKKILAEGLLSCKLSDKKAKNYLLQDLPSALSDVKLIQLVEDDDIVHRLAAQLAELTKATGLARTIYADVSGKTGMQEPLIDYLVNEGRYEGRRPFTQIARVLSHTPWQNQLQAVNREKRRELQKRINSFLTHTDQRSDNYPDEALAVVIASPDTFLSYCDTCAGSVKDEIGKLEQVAQDWKGMEYRLESAVARSNDLNVTVGHCQAELKVLTGQEEPPLRTGPKIEFRDVIKVDRMEARGKVKPLVEILDRALAEFKAEEELQNERVDAEKRLQPEREQIEEYKKFADAQYADGMKAVADLEAQPDPALDPSRVRCSQILNALRQAEDFFITWNGSEPLRPVVLRYGSDVNKQITEYHTSAKRVLLAKRAGVVLWLGKRVGDVDVCARVRIDPKVDPRLLPGISMNDLSETYLEEMRESDRKMEDKHKKESDLWRDHSKELDPKRVKQLIAQYQTGKQARGPIEVTDDGVGQQTDTSPARQMQEALEELKKVIAHLNDRPASSINDADVGRVLEGQPQAELLARLDQLKHDHAKPITSLRPATGNRHTPMRVSAAERALAAHRRATIELAKALPFAQELRDADWSYGSILYQLDSPPPPPAPQGPPQPGNPPAATPPPPIPPFRPPHEPPPPPFSVPPESTPSSQDREQLTIAFEDLYNNLDKELMSVVGPSNRGKNSYDVEQFVRTHDRQYRTMFDIAVRLGATSELKLQRDVAFLFVYPCYANRNGADFAVSESIQICTSVLQLIEDYPDNALRRLITRAVQDRIDKLSGVHVTVRERIPPIDPPVAPGDGPPDASAEVQVAEQKISRMTGLYNLAVAQTVETNDRLTYLAEAKTIAQELGAKDWEDHIAWTELFYRKRELDNSITARVTQCIDAFKSSKDIDIFLQSASELTDDIQSLDELELDYNTSPTMEGRSSYDAVMQVENLYTHGVFSQLMQEDRYPDTIRAGEQALNILGNLSESEHNTRAQLMILAYLTDVHRFLREYDSAIRCCEQMINLNAALPHDNDGYDPASDQKYLDELRELLATQEPKAGAEGVRAETADITTVALSTDIPEIPIPREVMERVMALGTAASNPSEVADALGISGATLRRWTSRFATELGVDMSTAVAGYPREYSRAQMILLANIRILLEQQLTYSQVTERIAALPQIAVTMPESTNALPAWAQERIDLAMADLGLSDQDSLRQAFVALAELGWRGAAVEERVIQEIQQRADQLNIPVASQAVAGFSEYLLGVLAMRNGENVRERLAELRPYLGRWISHNLSATAQLLPFLRGLRSAPIISALITTLADERGQGAEGTPIQWEMLTRETMRLVLQEVAQRATDNSPTDRIVRAAADILGQALASNDSIVAAEMRAVASDGTVHQGLRNLAAELKSKQSE